MSKVMRTVTDAAVAQEVAAVVTVVIAHMLIGVVAVAVVH